MVVLNASKLSLELVYDHLKFQELQYGSFHALLELEPVSQLEQLEIEQIRSDYRSYLAEGKVLEGMVKALTILLLLRLAGFYHAPIKIRMEEEIDRINIEDKDTSITGRFDLICVNKGNPTIHDIPFWVLIVEAKNSAIDSLEGLPQLLTYAYKSLERQSSVWGLTTNGTRYDFFYIQQGNLPKDPPSYRPMPSINFMEPESGVKLIQVLKAICKLQNKTHPI
jgi:hypothetical protein